MLDFQNCCSDKHLHCTMVFTFILYYLVFVFLSLKKVRNLQIGVDMLVGKVSIKFLEWNSVSCIIIIINAPAVVCAQLQQTANINLKWEFIRKKARVHNKRRERECLTLTMPCTNALCKDCFIHHRVFVFYINTYW